MLKSLVSIDNFVMDLVNYGVKTVNNITGLSRYEQACFVWTVSHAIRGIGSYGLGDMKRAGESVVYAGIGIAAMTKAADADEHDATFPERVKGNPLRKLSNIGLGAFQYVVGPSTLISSGMYAEHMANGNPAGYDVFLGASASLAATIARADPVRKQKNFVSRWLEEKDLQPVYVRNDE